MSGEWEKKAMSSRKDFVKEALEGAEKHVELGESKIPKKDQAKLVSYMREKIELDGNIKAFEERKKLVQDAILMLMVEHGEKAVVQEGVGKVTVVEVKGREKFDRPKMIKTLIGEGVKEAVINKAMSAAITVGPPSEYVKITGEKE